MILPRTTVTGILKVREEEIKVNGIRYHAGNWDVRTPVARNIFGWFWGKINFETYSAIRATIFEKRSRSPPILVINENDNGYINILPKDINFVGYDVKKKNWKYIPSHFDLKAKTKNINLDVSMEVSMSHYVKKIITLHYWQFHVFCKGSISLNGKTEKVNETQIAELLIFK